MRKKVDDYASGRIAPPPVATALGITLIRAGDGTADFAYVADGRHANTGVINRADRRLSTAARAFNAHFALLHAGFRSPLRRLVGRLLCSERSPFA